MDLQAAVGDLAIGVLNSGCNLFPWVCTLHGGSVTGVGLGLRGLPELKQSIARSVIAD